MIGRTVSHYRVISHLGAGGMGTVWLAEDTKLHRHVALKFLQAGAAPGEEPAERLLREARAASVLDHPHIATIYEVGEFEGQPFIAMAYYQGETLAERLARGPLPIAETVRIVAQVGDALSAAHAAGIVHRDLKPSNLMLTASGQVKVLDFGIATLASTDAETMTRLTGAGSTIGTAAYMSPEQAAGEEVDWRSDLWSLGVVAREMLTGRPVFGGTNVLAVMHAVMTTTPEPIRAMRPDVTTELEAIIARTMVRDRNARTITAGDVRDLAASCHARLSSGATPAARWSVTPRRVWIAAAVITVVVLGGAVAWWAQRNAKVRWAREQALPEIIRLAGTDKFDDAFRLAQEARRYIPDDPLLSRADPGGRAHGDHRLRALRRGSVLSSVWTPRRGLEAAGQDAHQGGPRPSRTPALEGRTERLRRRRRCRAGSVLAAPFLLQARAQGTRPRRDGPRGLVRLSRFSCSFRDSITCQPVSLPDYWIDQREVTNRDFQRFVDDGGYRRAELWREPFVKDGRPIAFDRAMALFVDTTGRPGPATWEQGAVSGRDRTTTR